MSVLACLLTVCFFFFKQKTAYEMRISDWSSDVCSSDLTRGVIGVLVVVALALVGLNLNAMQAKDDGSSRNMKSNCWNAWHRRSGAMLFQIGRASSRESVCQYV